MKIKTLLFISLLLSATSVFAQLNTSLLGHLYYGGIDRRTSNIWGYVANGKEYALVGVFDGTSIVDVTDPTHPLEVQFIPGPNSTWREIKTWGKYAYVTNEVNLGLQIIDLSNLPNEVSSYWWEGGSFTHNDTITDSFLVHKIHSLFIDEFGIVYLNGCHQTSTVGLLMIDAAQNPTNPPIVGFRNIYVHDCYARNNIAYTCDIYEGKVSIIDVNDKANLVLLAEQQTPNSFPHNAWLSNDSQTLFTTDEKSGAFVTAYNISDLSDITELDRYQSVPGSGTIPHNTYVLDDYLVTSYYKNGFTIVDATYANNLIEVGNYDTSPYAAGSGFNGCWGVYPYLPSGNILASDIEEGLFIVAPNYVKACYLQGTVTNGATNVPLSGAYIKVDTTYNTATSGFNGSFNTGAAVSGNYNIIVSADNFYTDTINVWLQNGEITTLNIELQPILPPSPPTANFTASLQSGCLPFSVKFNNLTLAPFNNVLWTFEGGQPYITNIENPNVTYTEPGTYSVTLVASNALGADTLFLDNFITVYPNLTISTAFDIDSVICIGSTVNLQAQANQPNVSFEWFGENISAVNNFTATATPNEPDFYTYIAIGTSTQGCTDSLFFAIEVKPNNLTLSLNELNDFELCGKEQANLQAICNDTTVLYNWTSDYGFDNVIADKASITFLSLDSAALENKVSVIVTDQYGCTKTKFRSFIIMPFVDITNLNTQTINNSFCTGTPITINAEITGNYTVSNGLGSYTWGGEDIQSTDSISATIFPTQVGTRLYNLQVINSYGCSDTSMITINVLPKPTIEASNDSICLGTPFTLKTNSNNCEWLENNVYLNTGNTVEVHVTTPGTYAYTANEINANNCLSEPVEIVVNANPTATINAPDTILVSNTGNTLVPITFTSADSMLYEITWQGNNLSCNNCINPIINAQQLPCNQTALYTLTLSNKLTGCSSTLTKSIQVFCEPVGINLPLTYQAFTIQANPNGTLSIKTLPNNTNQKIVLTLYNMIGEKVFEKKYFNANSLLNNEITIPNISTGIYLACLQTNEKQYSQTIIIR